MKKTLAWLCALGLLVIGVSSLIGKSLWAKDRLIWGPAGWHSSMSKPRLAGHF